MIFLLHNGSINFRWFFFLSLSTFYYLTIIKNFTAQWTPPLFGTLLDHNIIFYHSRNLSVGTFHHLTLIKFLTTEGTKVFHSNAKCHHSRSKGISFKCLFKPDVDCHTSRCILKLWGGTVCHVYQSTPYHPWKLQNEQLIAILFAACLNYSVH